MSSGDKLLTILFFSKTKLMVREFLIYDLRSYTSWNAKFAVSRSSQNVGAINENPVYGVNNDDNCLVLLYYASWHGSLARNMLLREACR